MSVRSGRIQDASLASVREAEPLAAWLGVSGRGRIVVEPAKKT